MIQDAEEIAIQADRALKGIPEEARMDLLKRAPFFAALLSSKDTLNNILASARQTQRSAEAIRACLFVLLEPDVGHASAASSSQN